jgi:hypothetical protein
MQAQALSAKDKLDLQKFDLQERRANQQAEYQDARLNQFERGLAMRDQGGEGGGKPKNSIIYDNQGKAYVVDVNNPTAPPIPIATEGGAQFVKPETAAERTARIKMEADAKTADKDFQNSLDAAAQADTLFKTATGSGIGSAADSTMAFFGKTTEGAKAAAQLKVMAGKLVAAVPKFSGPQSDADVKLYREMAGQVGDETLPVETRQAALNAVIDLQAQEQRRRNVNKAGGADVSTVPQKAKDYLLANPSAARDFDQKYGAGASAAILGGQ